MATIESIQHAYIDFVLIEGQTPESIGVFTERMNILPEEFYRFFNSFETIEQNIWADFAARTIAEIKSQDAWPLFTTREKTLSFFYTFLEMLKGHRSFVVYTIKKQPKTFSASQIFSKMRDVFEHFCNKLMMDGIKSDELSDRKFFTNRYKDALWVQLLFVLNFWINDNSSGFEKTSDAVENGVNVTFDLFQRSPIDDLVEFGKFLTMKRNIKQPISFGNN